MGRKKIEKAEINELKTEEIVSEDINTPVEEENAPVEDDVKIDAENTDVEQAKKEEEITIDEKVEEEIKSEGDFLTPEEAIVEITKEIEKEELKSEPDKLSNFIFLLEELVDSNRDVDFDIVNFKNQIRNLIAEFK